MNDWPKSQEVQPLKSWEKKAPEFKHTPVWDNVIYIKDRLAKIEEEQLENNVTIEKYQLLADMYFIDWYQTCTKEERTDFDECILFIGSQLARLQVKKDYFLRLLVTDISSLNAVERFDKTLMMFVMNPTNNMIKRNLKKCIKELIIINPKIYLYKSLYKNFEDIVEVTEHMLVDRLIEIDIAYAMQIFDNLPT